LDVRQAAQESSGGFACSCVNVPIEITAARD
jgi:hypothetical protein